MKDMTDEVKKSRAAPQAEYVKEFPCFLKLIEKHGHAKASDMLGLTNVQVMAKNGQVRPAYEMAAKLLLGDSEERVHSYVVKLTPGNAKIVLPLLDKLEVPHLELDF